jgi:hypothetical protein
LVLRRHGQSAKAGATIYGIVEAAKANALEPYAHLRKLLEQLLHAKTSQTSKRDIRSLSGHAHG